MKKGALQLSMNMIVTIIIAVVIFSMGIVILNQFVGGAEKIKRDLDSRTEEQIARLLEQGQQVAIPFSRQTVFRGESYLFGVGIVNINPTETPPAEFTLNVNFATAQDEEGNPIYAQQNPYTPSPTELLRYDAESFQLDKDERTTHTVLIIVPKDALSGTYAFNVEVFHNQAQYDTIKKIYVTVP